MAIAFGTGGAVATGTTSLSVAFPTSIAAGDLLILFVTNKYPTNGPSTPSGWTLLAQSSGGTGANGANSGSCYATVFYKIADGTETGNLAVTLTGANTSLGTIKRYTKGSTMSWGIASAVASRNTGNTTSWTETFTSDPGDRASDFTIVLSAINAGTPTYTLEALSQTGATLGSMTERQDTAGSNGDGVHIVITEQAVSSGTSSAAPTYAMTASASTANSPAGASVLIRLREILGGVVSTTLAAATLSAAGTFANNGALATTLSDASLAAVGTQTTSGALAQTLGAATLSAVGTQTDSGGLAQTLAAATLAAAGTFANSGALAATLQAATLTAVGVQIDTGAATSVLQDATLVAVGTTEDQGALSSFLADATLAATGETSIAGSLNATLASATLSATGAQSNSGVLASTLNGATLSATGACTTSGALGVTLADVQISAAGITSVEGDLAATLADAVLDATGEIHGPPIIVFASSYGPQLARTAIQFPSHTENVATAFDRLVRRAIGETPVQIEIDDEINHQANIAIGSDRKVE